MHTTEHSEPAASRRPGTGREMTVRLVVAGVGLAMFLTPLVKPVVALIARVSALSASLASDRFQDELWLVALLVAALLITAHATVCRRAGARWIRPLVLGLVVLTLAASAPIVVSVASLLAVSLAVVGLVAAAVVLVCFLGSRIPSTPAAAKVSSAETQQLSPAIDALR